MSGPAYRVAASVAGRIREHLRAHGESALETADRPDAAPLPDLGTITAMIDAAFWTSLRREEGTLPRISLALVPPDPAVHPLRFSSPIALEPAALAKLAPAVERTGIHLGAWSMDGRLLVWGTARAVPPLCFVVETVAPGLLVIKHRPWAQSTKFVNVAVLEGDRIKVIDEGASGMPDCPHLLKALLRFDARGSVHAADSVLVRLAVSMRLHGRGGTLVVVPDGSDAWQQSVLQPISYAVTPPLLRPGRTVAPARERPGLGRTTGSRGRRRRGADHRGRRNPHHGCLPRAGVRRQAGAPQGRGSGEPGRDDRADRGRRGH